MIKVNQIILNKEQKLIYKNIAIIKKNRNLKKKSKSINECMLLSNKKEKSICSLLSNYKIFNICLINHLLIYLFKYNYIYTNYNFL